MIFKKFSPECLVFILDFFYILLTFSFLSALFYFKNNITMYIFTLIPIINLFLNSFELCRSKEFCIVKRYNIYDYFFNIVILNKNQYHINNPSPKSIFIVCSMRFVFIIFLLIIWNSIFSSKYTPFHSVRLKEAIPIIGLFLGIYWSEKQNHIKKWDYIASLYNKIEENAHLTPNNTTPRGIAFLDVNLLHDLQYLEMWGHKSYNGIFKELTNKYIILFKKEIFDNTNYEISNIKLLENKCYYEDEINFVLNHLEDYKAILKHRTS